METIKITTDEPMIILSLEKYEQMKETIEILSNNPNIIEELKQERKEIENGNCISYKDFKKKHQL